MDATPPDWDDLLERFGPLAPAAGATRALLAQAARDGRLFRLVVDRDGFGSGDVHIDLLSAVPQALGRGARSSVLWECFYFTGSGPIQQLPRAVRPGWESFGDIPGLPAETRRAGDTSPLETLATVIAEPAPPDWAFELAARDSDVSLRRGVANHARAPGRALAALARDPEKAIRLALARHPNVLPETLAILAAAESAGGDRVS